MNAEDMAQARPRARERLLDTAYALFSHRGIRGVGIDEIIARSGVAKATFYRCFESKADLVLAFLARREQRWTHGFVEEGAIQRGGADPEARLLAIFDVFDGWFRSGDNFDACSFINVLLELGPHDPAGRACIEHLSNIRAMVSGWAAEAGLRDPDEFARSWHILMKGSIISAAEGDIHAAQRAKTMAHRLIDEHRTEGHTANNQPILIKDN